MSTWGKEGVKNGQNIVHMFIEWPHIQFFPSEKLILDKWYPIFKTYPPTQRWDIICGRPLCIMNLMFGHYRNNISVHSLRQKKKEKQSKLQKKTLLFQCQRGYFGIQGSYFLIQGSYFDGGLCCTELDGPNGTNLLSNYLWVKYTSNY